MDSALTEFLYDSVQESKPTNWHDFIRSFRYTLQ